MGVWRVIFIIFDADNDYRAPKPSKYRVKGLGNTFQVTSCVYAFVWLCSVPLSVQDQTTVEQCYVWRIPPKIVAGPPSIHYPLLTTRDTASSS